MTDLLSAVRHRGGRASQSGTSLVEVLLAIVLIGVAGVAVVAGFTNWTGTTLQQRDATKSAAIADSAAAALKKGVYLTCPDPNLAETYRTQILASGTGLMIEPGFNVRIASVEFQDPLGTGAFLPSCPGIDSGTQRIRITVTSTRSAPVEQEIVKRDGE